jgi:hypothetical protein
LAKLDDALRSASVPGPEIIVEADAGTARFSVPVLVRLVPEPMATVRDAFKVWVAVSIAPVWISMPFVLLQLPAVENVNLPLPVFRNRPPPVRVPAITVSKPWVSSFSLPAS